MVQVNTDRRFGVNAGAAIKVPVKAATTADVTLSGEQPIDGIACVTGDRVLVKDQTDPTENGIYQVDTSSWQRTPDFDGIYDVVQGTIVPVFSGSQNGSSFWRVTNAAPIIPGTDSIAFGLATGNILGTTIQVVDNVAALKALTGVFLDGSIRTSGYYAAGDGGHGVYRWNSADATADNGGTVIAPGDGSAGRWNLEENVPGMKQFGAKVDGTDATAAFNALAAAVPDGAAIDLQLNSGGPYSLNVTITKNLRIVADAAYGQQTAVNLRKTALVPFNSALPVVQIGDDSGHVSVYGEGNIDANGVGDAGLLFAGGAQHCRWVGFINGFADYVVKHHGGAAFPAYDNKTVGLLQSGVAGCDVWYVDGNVATFTTVARHEGFIAGPSVTGHAIRIDSTIATLDGVWVSASDGCGVLLENNGAIFPQLTGFGFVDSPLNTDLLLEIPTDTQIGGYLVGFIGIDGICRMPSGDTLALTGMNPWGNFNACLNWPRVIGALLLIDVAVPHDAYDTADLDTYLRNTGGNILVGTKSGFFDLQTNHVKGTTANGPCGQLQLGAAASTVVNNTSIGAASKVFLQPRNAAAATLVSGANSPYISALSAGASFTVTTAGGGAAAGTEVFDYWVIN